jgi:hypothetical protein
MTLQSMPRSKSLRSLTETDEITYWCELCKKEIKRHVKPRSLDGP